MFTAFLATFSKTGFSAVAYMGVHDVERKTTAVLCVVDNCVFSCQQLYKVALGNFNGLS
jgi:hypothetical protein